MSFKSRQSKLSFKDLFSIIFVCLNLSSKLTRKRIRIEFIINRKVKNIIEILLEIESNLHKFQNFGIEIIYCLNYIKNYMAKIVLKIFCINEAYDL